MSCSILQKHNVLGIEGVPSYLILHIASDQLHKQLLQPPLKETGIFRQLISCKGFAQNWSDDPSRCKYTSLSVEYRDTKPTCTEADIYSAVVYI